MERLLIITVMLLALSLSSQTTSLGNIYNIIKHVETENRVAVIGDGGKAYGVVQIHKICVADINRIYKTKYKHKQAFNAACSREMFMLYISAGIKLFEQRHCRSPTESDVVRMWNGGIYNGYKKKSTLPYLKRYIRYKKIHK